MLVKVRLRPRIKLLRGKDAKSGIIFMLRSKKVWLVECFEEYSDNFSGRFGSFTAPMNIRLMFKLHMNCKIKAHPLQVTSVVKMRI